MNNLSTTELLTALIILKQPRLEGHIQVVLHQRRKQTLKGILPLYAVRRTAEYNPHLGMARVKIHWSADLRRSDLQHIIRRAADAAYKVAINDTNADTIQELEPTLTNEENS